MSLQKYFENQIEGSLKQYLTYLLGCFLFSIGAKFFIDSHLGTDPLDVLCIGMTLHLPISIGVASGIVAFVFLSAWSLWNRKAPPLTPFFTTLSVGFLIDLWNFLKIESFTGPLLNSYVMLMIAVALCAYASALIIMSGIGIRIMDLVAISMVKKWNWSFFQAKMSLELLMFGVGWALGGPVGIGTIAFLFGVGPFIQPFMALNSKAFLMTNHGLAKAHS